MIFPRPVKTLSSTRLRVILLVFAAIPLVPEYQVEAQTSGVAAALLPGTKLSREIKGGEKHHFELATEENTVASILVRQLGVDVAVRLIGPQGKVLVETDLDIRTQGDETLEFVSSTQRSWTIEVDSKNKLVPAGSYEIVLVRSAAATERDRSLYEARLLVAEGQALRAASKYNEALAVNERALAIFAEVLGPASFEVGFVTNRMGVIYDIVGDDAKSEASARKALRIYESVLPADSLFLGDNLNNLGVIELNKGKFAEAESLLLRSMGVRERILGQEHRLYSQSLLNLGKLYRNRGDNDMAERAYEKALGIRERVLGKDHADVSTILVNIAAVKYFMGDYAAAAEYDKRALEIARKQFGPEDVRIAQRMSDLAVAYSDGGLHAEAEPLFLETLRVLEKKGNPLDSYWTHTLAALGRLYRDKGELEKARPLFLKAIELAEKKIENDPTRLAQYLLQYGHLQIRAGEVVDAERSLKRSLDIFERVLGPEHGRLSEVLDALALAKALMGNIPGAIDLQARANLLTERNIEFNLTTGSQNQRLLYLQLTDAEFNQTISLDVDKNGGARAREIAIAAVLQRKGRVLDALAATADLLRQRPNSDDTQLIRQLKDTNAQLAAISLNVPVGLKPEVYREQIADLQKEKERLEIELSRRTSASLKSSKTASTESIRALIPADSALIEFVAYRPIQKNTAAGADALYVAYVIRNAGEPAMVPIGKAVEIDPLVSEFRNSLRDIRRRDSQKLAKGIYAKLILPIRQALGDAKQLIVSPEGELNLMPFEALIDEKNKFLIEGHAISYVTSGRDLVRMQQKRESRSAPIIFADPDFGAVSDDRVASTGAAPSQRRRSITVTRELSGTYFAPLRGTATEADAIRKLFREAALRTSRDASEAAIKSVNAPQILHIATHGFFLTDTGLPGAVGNPDRQPSHPSNALLRSGLALFGANARNGSAEDGLLTALEASSLNLWGTKLVVLSACDTGIGEVRAGEGVFGLRRAFALAGAESLVMSLWPVSDHVTRELMVAYYKNLKEGTGRGESLRRAKLELLRRPGRSHPFYWASFIQSGEWANLSGTR